MPLSLTGERTAGLSGEKNAVAFFIFTRSYDCALVRRRLAPESSGLRLLA